MGTTGVGELMEVVLYVQDMNLQVSFYRDMLGLHVKEPDGVRDFRDFYYVALDTGSCILKLYTGGKRHQEEEDAPKLVFRVDNIHAIRDELLEKALVIEEVTSPAAGIWECEGRDPEGNRFAFQSQDGSPYSPRKVTPTPSMAPIYVSINSKRGRSITLLRDNKLVIAGEILVVAGLLSLLPSLQYVSLISVFLVIMVLLWLRGNTWSKLGLNRPNQWRSTIAIGITFGILFFALQSYFIGPIITRLVHERPNVNVFNPIHGNIVLLLGALINTWTSAAFAEEMIFRGYLMNRLADLFGYKFLGWFLALLIQATIFGIDHSYQGLSGILSTGTYGILSGLLYLATRRNLWTCAIAHGVVDTISFLLLFAF